MFHKPTFTDPLIALAYFTEVNLATLEGLPKSTSKREVERFKNIADEMVRHCKLFNITVKMLDSNHPKCVRLIEKLQDNG